MKFGERLKALRLERGIKQDDLAAAVGVSRYTLIRWEAGTFEPKLSDLVKLAQILEVSLDVLTGMEREKKPDMIEIRRGPLTLRVPATEDGYAVLRSKLEEMSISDAQFSKAAAG